MSPTMAVGIAMNFMAVVMDACAPTFSHVVDDGHHHAALVVNVGASKQQCHDSHAVHVVCNALSPWNAATNPASALVDLDGSTLHLL